MSITKEKYKNEVAAELKEKFSLKNVHQVAKLDKVTISSMSRDVVQNAKVVDSIVSDLEAITGQKPVIARAKKSIATFKVREGQALGAFVTLRGAKMYEFLDRLIHFSLPRVKDFRGLSPKGFDGRGNYTFGIKEQIMFPEISYDKIDKVRGMGIVISTTATDNEQGRELLRGLGMPFRK